MGQNSNQMYTQNKTAHQTVHIYYSRHMSQEPNASLYSDIVRTYVRTCSSPEMRTLCFLVSQDSLLWSQRAWNSGLTHQNVSTSIVCIPQTYAYPVFEIMVSIQTMSNHFGIRLTKKGADRTFAEHYLMFISYYYITRTENIYLCFHY